MHVVIFIIFNSTAERENTVGKAPGKAAAFSTGYLICLVTDVYFVILCLKHTFLFCFSININLYFVLLLTCFVSMLGLVRFNKIV